MKLNWKNCIFSRPCHLVSCELVLDFHSGFCQLLAQLPAGDNVCAKRWELGACRTQLWTGPASVLANRPTGMHVIYIYMYNCICMSVCLYVCMSVCLYVCMSVCMYECICTCTCIYIFIYTYIYIYIYIYLYLYLDDICICLSADPQPGGGVSEDPFFLPTHPDARRPPRHCSVMAPGLMPYGVMVPWPVHMATPNACPPSPRSACSTRGSHGPMAMVPWPHAHGSMAPWCHGPSPLPTPPAPPFQPAPPWLPWPYGPMVPCPWPHGPSTLSADFISLQCLPVLSARSAHSALPARSAPPMAPMAPWCHAPMVPWPHAPCPWILDPLS